MKRIGLPLVLTLGLGLFGASSVSATPQTPSVRVRVFLPLIQRPDSPRAGGCLQFAADARKWGHPFLLRIMHEMNGSWGYPWQETQNGNRRGEFAQAWAVP
jgi:hypothetical protein